MIIDSQTDREQALRQWFSSQLVITLAKKLTNKQVAQLVQELQQNKERHVEHGENLALAR